MIMIAYAGHAKCSLCSGRKLIQLTAFDQHNGAFALVPRLPLAIVAVDTSRLSRNTAIEDFVGHVISKRGLALVGMCVYFYRFSSGLLRTLQILWVYCKAGAHKGVLTISRAGVQC